MNILLREYVKKILIENLNDVNQEDLTQFIIRSNEIENYKLAEDEVREAIEGYLQGYPPTYVTQNPHIFSHLSGLDAAKRGFSTVNDITNIHRAMGAASLEAGAPGVLRSGVEAQSAGGTKYIQSKDVPEALTWWANQSWSNPFKAHTVYELIHPFGDGNGRSGRIILAAMLNFDFATVNNLIDQSYFSNLDKAGKEYQGEFWK